MNSLLAIASSTAGVPGRASLAYIGADGLVQQGRRPGASDNMASILAIPVGADAGIFHPRCDAKVLRTFMARLAMRSPGGLPTAGTWVVHVRERAGWRNAGVLDVWADPGGVSCVHRLPIAGAGLQPFAQAERLPDEVASMDLADPEAWQAVGDLVAPRLSTHCCHAELLAPSTAQTMRRLFDSNVFVSARAEGDRNPVRERTA